MCIYYKWVAASYKGRLFSKSIDARGVEALDRERWLEDPLRLASFRRNDIHASVKDSLSSSPSGTPVGLIHPLGLGVCPPLVDGRFPDLRINPICSFCSSDSWSTLAMTLRISYRLRSPLGAIRNPTKRLVISCLKQKEVFSWTEVSPRVGHNR